MTVFWLLTLAMVALAVSFVLVPLLRRQTPAGPSEVEANLEVLRGQRREIDADIASGTLPAEAREEVLAELVGRASTDLAPASPQSVGTGKPWGTAIAAGLAVPALAFGLYVALGSPDALVHMPPAAAAATQVDDKQILAMVESLATKVRERPDDARGWELLARSMGALGRFKESADAYAHLLKLVPPDAQILADYADVLGMAQGQSLAGRPAELVRRSLELEPGNHKARALAATIALDAGDNAAALRHWQVVADSLPPDSEGAREVGVIMAEIRRQPGTASAPVAAAKSLAAPRETISGSVALAPEIAARLSGTETVFIFARAEGGPRVPLAVVRAQSRELPMKFALDDSQAMAPGMNISSASALRVEARVSLSGNATAQSGDIVGTSAVVKPGARDVRVVVDKVLP